MSLPHPSEEEQRHREIVRKLKEQYDTYRDPEGAIESPDFRFFIDGFGNEHAITPPVELPHRSDSHGSTFAYEFAIHEAPKKVVTSIGDGNELLSRFMPFPDILTGYVACFIGDVINCDDFGFIFFFNKRLKYWHLAEASIRPHSHDTAKLGMWKS